MKHDGYGIKPLTTTRIPRSHIVLSVRSQIDGAKGVYEERWRVAATRYTRTAPDGTVKRAIRQHWNPGELWEYIKSCCDSKGLTFLWTHDLSRTARISQLLNLLPSHDWRLEALSLNPGASWMVFRRGESTLKVVDVQSIWPASLERIAHMFGLGYQHLPLHTAGDEKWLSAVTADRHVLQTGIDAYLNWLETNELGSLAVTGSSQAFAAFRRRFMTDGILVHNDEELYEHERRAMWTGRAEAWWHGSLLREVVDEWDFSNAYTRLAQECNVPVFPVGPFTDSDPWRSWLAHPTEGLLAEVEVSTDEPCLPVQLQGHIVWPTGSFRTVLWTPEIRLALEFGRTTRLLRGWRYRRAPALKAWADWVTARLGTDDGAIPAWEKDILKRWGNTLVGRFGMRYPKWDKAGVSTISDVYAMPGWDNGTGEEWTLMQVGHEMWIQTGIAHPRYSAPMVTGYIMSAMRAKLWRLMRMLPPRALLYVDTDSVLLSDHWRPSMQRITQFEPFRHLRLKRSWSGMSIYGPRQVVTEGAVRISGVPKAAQRLGRNDFEGEVTESLEQALAGRAFDRVRSEVRHWHVPGTDPRRHSDGWGWTRPLHFEQGGGSVEG